MGVRVREKPPGSGVFWVFINHAGRRKSKRIGTEDRALKIAKMVEAKLILGESDDVFKKDDSPTFKEVSKRYINLVEKNPELAKRTKTKYSGILKNHIAPAFGKKKVSEITRADLMDFFIKERSKGVSRSGIESRLAVINGVLKRAMSEGVINYLPTTGIKEEMRLKKKKPTPDPLNFDESETVLETISQNYIKFYPYIYPLVFTAFRSGLRIGELAGLKWADVDFRSKYIHIRHSFDGGYGPPKGNKTRKVDLSDTLADVLKDHRKMQMSAGMRLGLGDVPEPVFCDPKGQPLKPNQIRRIWIRILKKAEIRHHKFHSTRATFASQLLSRGADIYYVSKQLGHHSVKITEAQYLKWIPEDGKTAQVNLLDDAPKRTYPHPTPNKKAVSN